MGQARIAVRQTGNKVTTYLTSAGSKQRMKDLQDHPRVQEAQSCLENNNTLGDRKECLRKM